jgi:hypothetical protein
VQLWEGWVWLFDLTLYQCILFRCTAVFEDFAFLNESLSQEEEEFPLAYAILSVSSITQASIIIVI